MKRLFLPLLIALCMVSCKVDVNEYLDDDMTPTYDYTEEDLYTYRGDLKIYGRLYRPVGVEGKLPLVILSHGFNGTHNNGRYYAQAFAQLGYMCYALDFCGGSNFSKSDGETTSMSILTERADLEAVLDYFKTRDDVDVKRIALAGDSQGGMVTAITAADRADEIAAVLLFYPALCIVDDTHNLWGFYDNIPDRHKRGQMWLGAIYYQDAWYLDVYNEIAKYQGPILLQHGSEDAVVDISYSEKATDVYNDVEYHVIYGGTHGFKGKARKESLRNAVNFMKTIHSIK